MLIEKLMNFGRLVSLLTSLSLAVAACPGVYGCAWVVHFSVCVCCVPGSVPPSASASAVSVPVPDSSAPPSLRRRSLSLPVPVSVAVPGSSAPLSVSAVCLGPFLRLRLRLLCVCTCAWFVGSSVYVCCVFGFAKSVEKRANQCSIPRFTR